MDNIRFARICSVTGEKMDEGWVFGDGEDYAKYEADALKMAIDLGYKSISEAFKDDACYWTEWEDDCQYELVNGKFLEIENT